MIDAVMGDTMGKLAFRRLVVYNFGLGALLTEQVDISWAVANMCS